MADESYFSQIINALKGGPSTPQDAMPFGVGGPAEPAVEAPAILGHLAQGIMDIPKHLIDAAVESPMPGLRREDYTDVPGTAQPSGKLTGAAANTAMALAGVGAPAAEAGAAGIFGGKLAKTADLHALREAQRMAAGGEHPNDVLNATGWLRSPADHKWRFEIPDNNSSLKYMPMSEGSRAIGSVDSLIKHPELFKAYPELKGYGADITKDSSRPKGNGLYSTKDLGMYVNAPNAQVGRSVALHELQHGVQGIEGFSPGNNPAYYAYQIEKGLMNKPELLQAYDFDAIKQQAHDLYHKTAGEVESRNVQKRLDYSPATRANTPPWLSQDVPYKDQYHFDPLTETLRALRAK